VPLAAHLSDRWVLKVQSEGLILIVYGVHKMLKGEFGEVASVPSVEGGYAVAEQSDGEEAIKNVGGGVVGTRHGSDDFFPETSIVATVEDTGFLAQEADLVESGGGAKRALKNPGIPQCAVKLEEDLIADDPFGRGFQHGLIYLPGAIMLGAALVHGVDENIRIKALHKWPLSFPLHSRGTSLRPPEERSLRLLVPRGNAPANARSPVGRPHSRADRPVLRLAAFSASRDRGKGFGAFAWSHAIHG